MLNSVFCLLLIIVVVPGRTAKNCTTPNDEAGQCVPMKLCSVFNKYLENTQTKISDAFYQYLSESLCGFIKLKNYICCAAIHVIEDTEVSPKIYQQSTVIGMTEKLFVLPTINPEEPIPETDSRSDHKNIKLLELNSCGIVNSERISNGNKTELNEYPWMALLQYQTTSGLFEFQCGGSLITKRYVLTAAHCVHTTNKLVSVRLGEHDINTESDCEAGYCYFVQDIGIEEIIPHFKFQKRNFKNDIALIRLDKEANIQEENVKLICLPISRKFETMEHMTAIVSGWGSTEEHNKISNELLQAEVPVLPISECQNLYKSRITLSNSQICAGGKDYVDTCYGDSGGPLFTPATISGTQKISIPLYYQIGIVSTGHIKCGEMNSYTIFTSVSFYMDWILNNLKL